MWRKIVLFIVLPITIICWLMLLYSGIVLHNYSDLMVVCYQLSLFGLTAIYFLEMSDDYRKHGEKRGLLIGLCTFFCCFAAGTLIAMFYFDYSWISRTMQLFMLLLIAYSLFKAIKRR
ncbi:hypothetical protein ACMGE5_00675 [Macrococcus equi]|uniref:hypothetical protein n=1 Tax=Macrococcus equi TaxID=3395462 RepID=UPI0039BE869E